MWRLAPDAHIAAVDSLKGTGHSELRIALPVAVCRTITICVPPPMMFIVDERLCKALNAAIIY